MEMYYDEKLKRWVDPSDPDSMKPVDDIAPPPTDAQPSAAKGDTPPAQPAALGAEDAVGDLMTPPPSFRRRRKQNRSVSSPALLSPGKADASAGFGDGNSTPGVLPMPAGAAQDGPQHTPAQILVPGVPSETCGETPAKKTKTKHGRKKKESKKGKKEGKKSGKKKKESKKGKDTKKAKKKAAANKSHGSG